MNSMADMLGSLQIIPVAGCDYAAWTRGTGYPVVLLHGWPVTSIHWRAVVLEEEIPPGLSVEIPEPGASRYPRWHGGFHRQKPLAERLVSGKEREYFRFFLGLRGDPATLDPQDEEEFLGAYGETARLPVFFEYYRTLDRDSSFFGEICRSRLEVPALAIGGTLAIGAGVVEAARELFSKVDARAFEAAGHYPAQEDPEPFAQAVISFVKNVTRS